MSDIPWGQEGCAGCSQGRGSPGALPLLLTHSQHPGAHPQHPGAGHIMQRPWGLWLLQEPSPCFPVTFLCKDSRTTERDKRVRKETEKISSVALGADPVLSADTWFFSWAISLLLGALFFRWSSMIWASASRALVRFRSFRSRFSDSKSRWLTWVDTRSWGSGLPDRASSSLPQAHASPCSHSRNLPNGRRQCKCQDHASQWEKPGRTMCGYHLIPQVMTVALWSPAPPPPACSQLPHLRVPSLSWDGAGSWPGPSPQSPLTWSLSVVSLLSSSLFSRSTFCLSSYSSSSCTSICFNCRTVGREPY